MKDQFRLHRIPLLLFLSLVLIVFSFVFFSKTTEHGVNALVVSETPSPFEDGDTLESIITTTPPPPPEQFIEIVNSCGPTFQGECVYGHMHIAGEHMPVMRLRTGMVLKVGGVVIIDDETWYEVVFDEWLRYPERLTSELLVRERDAKLYVNDVEVGTTTSTSTKRIVVDRSEQKLHAYDGNALFMVATTSTGLDITPTPRGIFTIFRKTPSRYMQGPIPGISEKQYDLPGVPWNLYFTNEGAVIHGAYWHDSFGIQWSNGCVNLPPQTAKALYEWAEVGTVVVVQD